MLLLIIEIIALEMIICFVSDSFIEFIKFSGISIWLIVLLIAAYYIMWGVCHA